MKLNTWYHVAGTFNGSVLRIYINGEQVATLNSTPAIVNSTFPAHVYSPCRFLAVWNPLHYRDTLVALRGKKSASAFARRLRLGNPPVYTRLVEDHVCLDPRTIQDGEEDLLLGALKDNA